MKLTRNKIRKIRKQVHQSVRKWKKGRNSNRRRVATFRRSPPDMIVKRKNVFNKTLKKYIPLQVLEYLKEKYLNMRRLRRKQRRMKNMTGGDTEPAANGAKPAAKGAKADDKKKSGGFNLGIDIPGDIPIHSDTFEVTGDNTSKLLEFLIANGLPYYLQFEMMPGTPLKLNDASIYDLYRILYGSFATKDEIAKAGDRKRMFFEPGKTAGVAAGDSVLLKELGNDIYIFTTDVLVIDKNSQKNKITLVSEPTKPSKQTFTIENDTRLYKVDENGTPASIENLQEDCDPLGGSSSIKLNEIRLQVSPLSDAAFKKAVATSSNDDGKKRRKVISDDGTSYVLNMQKGTKITSIQTLRKSLERVRESLEEEDDISKTNASEIFEMINDLLLNPEFAKNDGYDDFKKNVFEFTYKIPGTERKYGFAQMMTFFEDKKDELPKDLGEKFTKLLTLLDHGPAGANGSCVAFNNNHALEVIEYTTTLENGDIVTTKKLGSKMNIEGFGDKLDKLNDSNKPKEEDEETKAEGGEGEGDKKAEGGEDEGDKTAEGGEDEGDKTAEGGEDVNNATAAAIASAAIAAASAAAAAPAPSEEANKNDATAAAIASAAIAAATAAAPAAAAAAEATADKATAEHISLKEIPNEPVPPSREIIAINKLYEKYDKKPEKVKRLLELKRALNQGLKQIIPLFLEIITKSVESQKTWKENGANKNTPINLYVTTKQFTDTMAKLETQLKELKNSSNYKFIKDKTKYTDEVVSEFNPSMVFAYGASRDLLIKICKLFETYPQIMFRFNEGYEYFKNNQKMKGGMFGTNPSPEDVVRTFNNLISTFKYKLTELDKDSQDTDELEKQLLPETAQQVV